jgi:hypothetical protein
LQKDLLISRNADQEVFGISDLMGRWQRNGRWRAWLDFRGTVIELEGAERPACVASVVVVHQ